MPRGMGAAAGLIEAVDHAIAVNFEAVMAMAVELMPPSSRTLSC